MAKYYVFLFSEPEPFPTGASDCGFLIVTTGKSFYLSESHFPHLQNGTDSATWFSWGANEIKYIKSLERHTYSAHRKCWLAAGGHILQTSEHPLTQLHYLYSLEVLMGAFLPSLKFLPRFCLHTYTWGYQPWGKRQSWLSWYLQDLTLGLKKKKRLLSSFRHLIKATAGLGCQPQCHEHLGLNERRRWIWGHGQQQLHTLW